MKKTVTAIILIAVLILTMIPLAVSAAPEGTAVSNAAQFEAMVTGGTYYLTNDIDLGGKEYSCYIFDEFSGTINGCGYSVFNYSLNNNGTESDVGTILRANKTGNLIITDLSFGKESHPVKLTITSSGKSHGVICGAQENSNSMTLTNVNVYAEMEVPTLGKCNVGGYIGYSRAFTMTNCKMYGKVTVGSGADIVDTVYHNAGGFVGSANNDAARLDNCENHAEITTYCSTVEARAAGFIAYTGNSIQLENCVNFGSITCYDTAAQLSSSQTGGFIGHVNKATSVAFLTKCENNGKVTGTNWCSPFVANSSGSIYFEGCINNAEYTKTAVACGSFIGNNTGIIDVDAFSIDKTDPNATTPAETTTSSPVTTAAPVTTTAPVTNAKITTAAPATDAPATTPAATAKEPEDEKSGCGGLITSPVILALLSGVAYGIFKKKKD